MMTLSKYVHGKSVNLETLYTWSAIQLNEDTLQYTHSAEAFSLMASQEKRRKPRTSLNFLWWPSKSFRTFNILVFRFWRSQLVSTNFLRWYKVHVHNVKSAQRLLEMYKNRLHWGFDLLSEIDIILHYSYSV